MALVINDRVKETSTTTGTGALTFAGATSGFETFSAGIGNSNTTYYAIVNTDTPTEWEVGLGTLAGDSSTITRTTPISSSNSDSAVDFGAGTKEIFCTLPASKAVIKDASGNVTPSGVITGTTVEATGDTAAGDDAAMGYTSAEGLILTGQGSTNDVTIKNDADADVITIATGATNVDVVGDLTAGTLNADGDTAASDNAAIGYTAAEGLILTGQGSTNDVTVKNDADTTVISIPTGATGVTFAGTVGSGAITSTGVVTGTGFTIGSAVINEAELETIDGVTAGTVTASKAVVVDSNKDIGTFRNVTIDGTFSDGNYTFDTSGNVSSLGTVGCGAITSTGVVTGTGFTIGSAVINEAELETIDGVTAGTVSASKALVVDSNKDLTALNDVRMDSLGVATAASGTSGEIRATNDVTAFYGSDIALKENIVNIPSPMNLVKKINGVIFDWKQDYIDSKGGEDGYFVRKKDVGVIANEVEKILPEIVATRKDGMKAVKYDRLTSLLIECVKDLQGQIDTLRNRS